LKQGHYSWLLAAAIAAQPLAAQASGFAITEQSASGLGAAYAGGAAEAADPSTIFYNPAGMVRLPGRQFAISGQFIRPSARLGNVNAGNGLGAAGGDNGGDAGSTSLIPDFYYVADAGRYLKYGLSVTAPFGLKSEYDPTWAGRYYAIKSELSAIDISPALAGKIDAQTSWGAALDIERGHADLSRAVDFGSLCVGQVAPVVGSVPGAIGACAGAPYGVSPHKSDATTEVSGNNWAYGYHLGLLHAFSPATRVGINYRSKITHHIDGTAAFSNVPAFAQGTYHTTGAHATVTMPDSLSISAVHEFSPAWTVMGDFTWTHWSRFHDLTVALDGLPTDSTLENWQNTRRYSLGARYQASAKLALRGGIAYDQSPVPDATRSPIIPDNNRRWVAFGVNYKMTPRDMLDAGYAHAFMSDSSVNLTDAQKGYLQGTVSSHADVLGLQYSHAF
jgi:long-chain fatty acid transport protein